MIEQVLRGFFHLHVAGQRGHDRLRDALRPHLFDDLAHGLGEYHRRGDDGVPVAQDDGVDTRVFQPQPDGVLVGRRRLTPGDVHRVARRPEWRDELAKRGIQIARHRHQR